MRNERRNSAPITRLDSESTRPALLLPVLALTCVLAGPALGQDRMSDRARGSTPSKGATETSRAERPGRDACVQPALQAEKELGIPRGFVLAVALVESGGGGIPTPFALNINDKAVMARSATEAVRYLRDPQGKLRSRVYVGCMQLSLTNHKGGFRPVERIVEPEANVRYAARYLLKGRAETGSWSGALARYNGGVGAKGRAYQCKVKRYLDALGAESSALIDGKGCAKGSVVVAQQVRRAFNGEGEPTS